jgi:hypothetical protein
MMQTIELAFWLLIIMIFGTPLVWAVGVVVGAYLTDFAERPHVFFRAVRNKLLELLAVIGVGILFTLPVLILNGWQAWLDNWVLMARAAELMFTGKVTF